MVLGKPSLNKKSKTWDICQTSADPPPLKSWDTLFDILRDREFINGTNKEVWTSDPKICSKFCSYYFLKASFSLNLFSILLWGAYGCPIAIQTAILPVIYQRQVYQNGFPLNIV